MDFGFIELDIADVDNLVEKNIKKLEKLYIDLIDYECNNQRAELLIIIEDLKKVLK